MHSFIPARSSTKSAPMRRRTVTISMGDLVARTFDQTERALGVVDPELATAAVIAALKNAREDRMLEALAAVGRSLSDDMPPGSDRGQ